YLKASASFWWMNFEPAKVTRQFRALFPLLVFLLGGAQVNANPARAAYGEHGMVATINMRATEVGVNILKQGGNAIDAAAAVGMALGVVDGANSGIGGGCFILIRKADGSVVAIDGREMAPAAASRNMFVRDGKGDTELSQTGALASGVPGALAA